MRRTPHLLYCILCTCLLSISLCACGKKDEEEVDNRKPVKLNETLTNDLSEIESLKGLDRRIATFMSEWQLKGAQLCIMKNDSLLYAKGYGWADKEKEERMQPYHILRLASVSKLITATGIMILQERGALTLKDTVFGPHGILNDSLYTKAIKDRNIYKITVEDLLRHKGGFTSRAGDPMFSTRTIMLQNHLKEPPSHETLARIVLGRNLSFVPGTSQYYSNFGYLLLSMIIEKLTGEPYDKWIQKNVFKPALCEDFHIANNYYKDKHRNEVRYYVPSNEAMVSEYNNSGRNVVRCYGGNDIHALSGAGAWVGSTPELARFVASIDIRRSIRDIIDRESIHQMVQYFDEDTYSLGWNDTAPESGWKRTGTFSGTSVLIHFFPDGECWIFATNTSTWKGPSLSRYEDEMFKELRSLYSDLLPKRDLFFEEESPEADTLEETPSKEKKEKAARKKDRGKDEAPEIDETPKAEGKNAKEEVKKTEEPRATLPERTPIRKPRTSIDDPAFATVKRPTSLVPPEN